MVTKPTFTHNDHKSGQKTEKFINSEYSNNKPKKSEFLFG